MDAGLEAPGGEDAADRSRVVAGVPVAIEMRLDRHSPDRDYPDRGGLVLSGRMSAPVDAEFTGVVPPANFLVAAIEPPSEVNGNAAHDDDPFSTKSQRLICPEDASPPGGCFSRSRASQRRSSAGGWAHISRRSRA